MANNWPKIIWGKIHIDKHAARDKQKKENYKENTIDSNSAFRHPEYKCLLIYLWARLPDSLLTIHIHIQEMSLLSMAKIQKIVYFLCKSEINSKKIDIDLYMSIFFCNFAAQN